MERQIPELYLIVEATQDGGVQVHEMKKWCRLHPEQTPPGMSAATNCDNSQRLRRGFEKMGWSVIETPSEVRIQRPCEAGQADELLGDVEALSEFHEDSESLADTVFHLERTVARVYRR